MLSHLSDPAIGQKRGGQDGKDCGGAGQHKCEQGSRTMHGDGHGSARNPAEQDKDSSPAGNNRMGGVYSGQGRGKGGVKKAAKGADQVHLSVANTEEFIDGTLTGNLGEVLICNLTSDA
jgi:hypothetical protein